MSGSSSRKPDPVIASSRKIGGFANFTRSEAIQKAASTGWIASSQELLAMTGEKASQLVVPANAGTHNHRWFLFDELLPHGVDTFRLTMTEGMGPGLRRDDEKFL